MGETAIQEPATVMENVGAEQAGGTPDYIDPTFDDSDLFNFVAENANVMVSPSWLPGVEMPLGAAMFHVRITRENVYSLLAEVQQQVSSRLTEVEDIEEEEFPAEDEPLAPVDEEPQRIEEKVEPIDPEIVLAEKVKPEVRTKSDTKETTAENQLIESQQVAETVQPIVVPPKISKTENVPVGTKPAPKARTVRTQTSPAPRNDSDKPTVARKHETVLKIKEPAPHQRKEKTPQLTPDERLAAQPVENREARAEIEAADILAESLDGGDLLGIPEPTALEPAVNILEESEVLADESVERIDVEPARLISASVVEADGLVEFVEEEVLQIEHPGIVETDDPLVAHEQSRGLLDFVVDDSFEQTQILGSQEVKSLNLEEPAPTAPVFEAVEQSLARLDEFIGAGEPEVVETVNEKLETIISVAQKLELKDGETMMAQAEIQEELRAAFTELLETVGIEPKPELIESLAMLTLQQKHVGEGSNEEEEEAATQDRGTHEVIKKWLAGLNSLQKSVANAYIIGKSAVRLYRFNLKSALDLG